KEDVARHRKRRTGAVVHQSGAGRALGEAALLQMHRLEEGAVLAGGLEAERGEALGDQVRSSAMAGAARLAALHIVRGKGRDGRPPGAGTPGLRCGWLRDSGGGDEGERKQEGEAHAALLASAEASR